MNLEFVNVLILESNWLIDKLTRSHIYPFAHSIKPVTKS